MSDTVQATIAELYLHPIKSCAGVPVDEGLLIETGLELDRAWMVVDEHGGMLTQRELPRLALVQPRLRGDDMVLRAPGMLALHVSLDAVEGAARARVWDDEVKAYDMGDLAAQWFSDFLGRRARLVRFDPDQQRLASRRWTGDLAAPVAFADGFAVLVTSLESLGEVNRRLVAAGHAPVTMARFRPNLVLQGVQAFDEDHLRDLVISTDEGPVTLRLVKPCARCTIPDVDPVTAEQGHAVGDTLAGFRADARVGGALTFGMNAIVVDGVERMLRRGQAVQAHWNL